MIESYVIHVYKIKIPFEVTKSSKNSQNYLESANTYIYVKELLKKCMKRSWNVFFHFGQFKLATLQRVIIIPMANNKMAPKLHLYKLEALCSQKLLIWLHNASNLYKFGGHFFIKVAQ